MRRNITVRAKFKVTGINRSMGGKTLDDGSYVPVEIQTVSLSPVYSDDSESENRKFWEATPSGEIKLGCINLEAAEHFELDGEYYVDFTPALPT